MIDLHTHTDASDGTYSPERLVEAAVSAGVTVLGIADHDTFAGYELAERRAEELGLRLIRGIELTCGHAGENVHLLAYFLNGAPSGRFDGWVADMLETRRNRNREMAARLRELGLEIELEEVERLGRHTTGRPHFARLLVEKGYARNREEAFERYIGESAVAYVPRRVTPIVEGIARVREDGGVTSIAHPWRAVERNSEAEERFFREMANAGLTAVEAHHSDHTADDVEHYLGIAARFGLAVTGGSDFHGDAKPGIELGRGINGNLRVPPSTIADLEARSPGHRRP